MSTDNITSVLHRVVSIGQICLPNYKTDLHFKCRTSKVDQPVQYNDRDSQEEIWRIYVPDDNVRWTVEWPEYYPKEYTSPRILKKPPYADSEYLTDMKWNELDGTTDRRSHLGQYAIDPKSGRPLNPVGRTGISGRGLLGKWAVNHAADPIVTRWKMDKNGNKVIHPKTNKPILQFVAICRLDTNEWAIPGGMCDPGEKVSLTLKREFMEEATNSLSQTEDEKKNIEKTLDKLFNKGIEIYKGYVDDPRNTDNAWMETVAFNFHDSDNTIFRDFKLSAGDDAGKVAWMDIDSSLKLYASHKSFIELTVNSHHAHW